MFNFMSKLKSHQKLEQKYDRIVQKGFPNTSNPMTQPTTEFGEYYAKDGSIRIDGFMNEATNYLSTNIFEMEHKQAIEKYRYMSMLPEVDDAIEEIINEAIVLDESEDEIVKIDFTNDDITDNLKEVITEEFKNIRDNLLQFKKNGQNIFRQWYIDGCLYIEKVFNPEDIRAGIQHLNVLDSYYVTYYSVVDNSEQTLKMSNDEIDRYSIVDSFFIVKKPNFNQYYYQANPMFNVPKSGPITDGSKAIKVSPEAICFIDSGLYHPQKYFPYSYLHKGLKVANQLTLLEDALLIYRITRAPERRVFFIEVGNMAPNKAEEYIRKLMRQYRQNKIYDANTGDINERGAFMAMTEDFWLPRRNGQSTTDVTTLQGGQNLSEVEDLNYFANKIWRALNVPYTRRADKENNGVQFNTGRELTVEELKFFKFILKLRMKFSQLFDDLLTDQLLLKRIVNAEEIQDVLSKVKYIFHNDNYFSEFLKLDILDNRLDIVNTIDSMVGKYIDKQFVWKEIFNFTDDEISEMKERIELEKNENPDENPEGNSDEMGEMDSELSMSPPPGM